MARARKGTARRPRTEYVQPSEPAAVTFKDEPLSLNPTQVYASDDPIVKAFPHLFSPLHVERQRPAVESATAEPGEVRGS